MNEPNERAYMEKKYIDVSKLNLYDDLFMKGKNDSGVWVRYRDVENLIKNAPAADVREVRHGEWVKNEKSDDDWCCSVCGYGLSDNRTRFCYDCGAIMNLTTLSGGERHIGKTEAIKQYMEENPEVIIGYDKS